MTMPTKKEAFKLGKSQANPKTHVSIEEEDEMEEHAAMTPAKVKGGKVGRKRTDSINDSAKGEQKQQESGGKSSSVKVSLVQKMQNKVMSQAKVVLSSQTYNKTRDLTG